MSLVDHTALSQFVSEIEKRLDIPEVGPRAKRMSEVGARVYVEAKELRLIDSTERQ